MRCVDTGHAALSAQLPGGGWPAGVLVDLLLQQPGIGEMRLLRPALAAVASRAAGVQPGMRRGGVLMLMPEAQVHERSPPREAEALYAAKKQLAVLMGGNVLPIRDTSKDNK
jgi:protein ImuA